MPVDASIRNRLGTMIEWGELALPVLPEAVGQVMSLVQRPRCEVHQLTAVIERDATLTAQVLQLARSPAYLGATKATSIAQIVQRLGFATILQLTMALASQRVFRAPGFDTELRASFHHALVTALFAQAIARMRRSTVDVAFVAGLLHDIGKPVLIQTLVDLHAKAGASIDREGLLELAEESHCAAGVALAERWAVAPVIGVAVGKHHDPAGHELAHLVALADALAHDEPVGGHAVALDMYPEDVEAVAAQRADIIATAEMAS
jgi:putative nucleotidyltransferase with HDIG domain